MADDCGNTYHGHSSRQPFIYCADTLLKVEQASYNPIFHLLCGDLVLRILCGTICEPQCAAYTSNEPMPTIALRTPTTAAAQLRFEIHSMSRMVQDMLFMCLSFRLYSGSEFVRNYLPICINCQPRTQIVFEYAILVWEVLR